MSTKEINIIAEPQIDPNVCRFRTDYQLYEGVISVTNKEIAEGSPLLEGLFGIEGVKEVMVAGNSVTVMKSSNEEWQEFIYSLIDEAEISYLTENKGTLNDSDQEGQSSDVGEDNEGEEIPAEETSGNIESE